MIVGGCDAHRYDLSSMIMLKVPKIILKDYRTTISPHLEIFHGR